MNTEQNEQQPLLSSEHASTLQAPAQKFCKHCGGKIPVDAVICTLCGRQIEALGNSSSPNIVIQNTNQNQNTNVNTFGPVAAARARNKWVAFFLCLFLGGIGAHKFYEGKNGMGILYIFTLGLFGIGWFIDLISLLFKPNPYFV